MVALFRQQLFWLFAAQGFDGVFFAGPIGGDGTGKYSKKNTNQNQNQGMEGREISDAVDLAES